MVGAKPVIGTPGTGGIKERGNYGVAGKRFRMEAALHRGSGAKKSRGRRGQGVCWGKDDRAGAGTEAVRQGHG